MATVNPDRRISTQNLVSPPKLVLPEGHPDLLWIDPSKVLIIKNGAVDYSRYLTSSTGALSTGVSPVQNAEKAVVAGQTQEKPDVPDLTDIEIFSSSKYYDPVTKVEKAKIVIKVMNSSKNKDTVEGVDARIYNPSDKL